MMPLTKKGRYTWVSARSVPDLAMGIVERIGSRVNEGRSLIMDFIIVRLVDRRHDDCHIGKAARWLTGFFSPLSGVKPPVQADIDHVENGQAYEEWGCITARS